MGGTTVDVATRTVTFDLDTDETIDCTFTDRPTAPTKGDVKFTLNTIPDNAADVSFSGGLGSFALDDDGNPDNGLMRLYVPAAPQHMSDSGRGTSFRPGSSRATRAAGHLLRVGEVAGVVVGHGLVHRVMHLGQAELDEHLADVAHPGGEDLGARRRTAGSSRSRKS